MPVNVRYIVDDVDKAVDFYCEQLGFAVEMRPPGRGFAMLSSGDLVLLLNEPGAGGAGQTSDPDVVPGPGGWCRFQRVVDDLDAEVARLTAAGVPLRGEPVCGQAGRQVVIDDPSGNPVELFEPASH